MSNTFQTHILNDVGIARARAIGDRFEDLLAALNNMCPPGREMAIVITKLQEAAFFAKRSVASLPENQKTNP